MTIVLAGSEKSRPRCRCYRFGSRTVEPSSVATSATCCRSVITRRPSCTRATRPRSALIRRRRLPRPRSRHAWRRATASRRRRRRPTARRPTTGRRPGPTPPTHRRRSIRSPPGRTAPARRRQVPRRRCRAAL